MSVKKFVFFELTDYALLRFPKWIAQEILNQDSNVEILFSYLYKYKKGNSPLEGLPINSKTIYLEGQISNIDIVLEQNKGEYLLTFALRPPEFYVVKKANDMGFSTNLVQHGIFVPFMKRELGYYIEESRKMILYIKAINSFSKLSGMTPIKCLKEIFSIYFKGNKTIGQSLFVNLGILPERAFVYSKFWMEYFSSNYGFEENDFIYTGTPDLSNYKDVPKLSGIGYICQTLVEDGRLPKGELKKFIDIFIKFVPKEEVIYLKLHPRSRIELYQKLIERENTIICDSHFPFCSKYVGHYSTLLAMSLCVTNNVFFWEFDGHPIPEFFSDFNVYRGKDGDEFASFLQQQDVAPPNLEKIRYYFNQPGMEPFKIVAQALMMTK